MYAFSYYHYGYFQSPGYPCYPNNKDCSWLIETSYGGYIYLYFYQFHLQHGGSNCPWDFVEIYDGNTPWSPRITRACGQLAPWGLYSSGRFLLIKFHSDGAVPMPGFSAYYYSTRYSKSCIVPFVPSITINAKYFTYNRQLHVSMATLCFTKFQFLLFLMGKKEVFAQYVLPMEWNTSSYAY